MNSTKNNDIEKFKVSIFNKNLKRIKLFYIIWIIIPINYNIYVIQSIFTLNILLFKKKIRQTPVIFCFYSIDIFSKFDYA